MVSEGRSVESKEEEAKKQAKLTQSWLKSFILGALTTVIALIVTLTVSSDQSSPFLTLPLGIIFSGFLGVAVFFAGTFIRSE